MRARYDYDPYGKVTKTSGDLEAEFAYTGHRRHAPTGLHLALYRAYDAELGRWLSRDPVGSGVCFSIENFRIEDTPQSYEIPR